MKDINNLMKDYGTLKEDLSGKERAIESLEGSLSEHKKILGRDRVKVEEMKKQLSPELKSYFSNLVDENFEEAYRLYFFSQGVKNADDVFSQIPVIKMKPSLETEVLSSEIVRGSEAEESIYKIELSDGENEEEQTIIETQKDGLGSIEYENVLNELLEYGEDQSIIKTPKYELEFIRDEKLLREICKYGESILDNPDEILKAIIVEEDGTITGSTPMFAVLTNMYLEKINDERRIAIGSELNSREKGYCVEEGLILTGCGTENSSREEPFLNYFEERGIQPDEKTDFYLPAIKIELDGLSLNRQGLIIPGKYELNYTLAENLFGTMDFNFNERDSNGIPQQNPKGNYRCLVAKKPGLFRCATDKDSYFWANMKNFDYSTPDGRIVLAKLIN